jgi:uncharacterized Rmd1/YagE family protein
MEEKNIKKPVFRKIKKSFSLLCLYLGDGIDLKKMQEKLKKYPYITREHPIVLKLATGQYAVLTKFGTVTFWNVPKGTRNELIKEISPFVENFDQNYPYLDTLKVFTGKEIEDVRFGKVYLMKIDKEKVQIISFVLSQSVALERFEKEIEERVSELEKVINILKSGVWRGLGEKRLLGQIGDILSVKQKTISHLSLFDKPETTWERPEIERLYNKLYFEFELPDRFDILNEKIKFLSDHNKILLDFISTQRSNFLEAIIIALILIEILIFIFEVFFLKKF